MGFFTGQMAFLSKSTEPNRKNHCVASSIRHQTPVLGARISLTFKTKDPSFKAKDLKTFKVKAKD